MHGVRVCVCELAALDIYIYTYMCVLGLCGQRVNAQTLYWMFITTAVVGAVVDVFVGDAVVVVLVIASSGWGHYYMLFFCRAFI